MFDCVMPAAGASSRMRRPPSRGGGTLLKPLLPFGSATLVETSVRAAVGAGCRVLLVLGNGMTELASLFEAEAWLPERKEGRLLFVENPRWEEGLLGSIQAALPLVEGGSFFIAHADLPFIASEDYRSLAAALSAGPQGAAAGTDAALFASHEGQRGHPVLLPSAWIPEILVLGRGGRLRDFLEVRQALLVETGIRALRDIDTPDEYKTAMEVP